jgi:hypothetical protein
VLDKRALKGQERLPTEVKFAYVQNKNWPNRKSCFVGGQPFLEKKHNPIP